MRPHRQFPVPHHAEWIPASFHLQRRIKENLDTVTLWLKSEDNNFPRLFLPGQFNMLYVWGYGEVPISISGWRPKTAEWMHTVRNVGAISRQLVSMKAGDWLGLRGPFGSHWPLEHAQGRDVLIIAGGIGFAPLRLALIHLMTNREDYGDLVVFYGARTEKDFLFKREVDLWSKSTNCQFLRTIDHPTMEWKSYVGVVTELFSCVRLNPERLIAFICGPEVMMRFALQDLRRRGVPLDSIYLSMERNMKCATGLCGHCQLGPYFVCRDGPIFCADEIETWIKVREC